MPTTEVVAAAVLPPVATVVAGALVPPVCGAVVLVAMVVPPVGIELALVPPVAVLPPLAFAADSDSSAPQLVPTTIGPEASKQKTANVDRCVCVLFILIPSSFFLFGTLSPPWRRCLTFGCWLTICLLFARYVRVGIW
jgi:hypothetical protein